MTLIYILITSNTLYLFANLILLYTQNIIELLAFLLIIIYRDVLIWLEKIGIIFGFLLNWEESLLFWLAIINFSSSCSTCYEKYEVEEYIGKNTDERLRKKFIKTTIGKEIVIDNA